MLRIYSPSGHPNYVDKCVSSLDQIPFPSENRAGRFYQLIWIECCATILFLSNQGITIFLYNFWRIVCLLLLYRTVENRQEIIGRREGSGIGTGPRDGNRTWVAMSNVELYVGALTTRLSALGYSIYNRNITNFRIQHFDNMPMITVKR